MKEAFIDTRFNEKSRGLIKTANAIIAEYAGQGFQLTLRQLYYQFVSRAVIENTERSYKNLGSLISDARMAGEIDWNAIEDRTRNLRGRSHWDSPVDIAETCVSAYFKDRWEGQKNRIEVWVEKEALAGVADAACHPIDVPYFCCKGYTSQSEMYGAAQRLLAYKRRGQKPVIIHLGDHDPSGIDMSRDIQERLHILTRGCDVEFHRIALNMNQIKQYNPPPNPAKMTDSRFKAYRRKHGESSWELDALEPKLLVELIQGKAKGYINQRVLNQVISEEEEGKDALRRAVDTLREEE